MSSTKTLYRLSASQSARQALLTRPLRPSPRYFSLLSSKNNPTVTQSRSIKPAHTQWPPVQTIVPRRFESTTTTTSTTLHPVPEFHTDASPGRTALHDLHVAHGAKMVPFGGYLMPLQYADQGVSASHHWTRERASLFDVGHMVQYHVEGPGAAAFLARVTPAGVHDLAPGQASLSALLHPGTGGIVDDCIVTRLDEGPRPELFYLVLNAGCREKDHAFLREALEAWGDGPPVAVRHLQTSEGAPWGLVALQGPLAAEILKEALSPACRVDVGSWWFGTARHVTLSLPGGAESRPVVASRGGYTGEDGFELSIHPSQTVEVTKRLLEVAGPDRLRLAGLGARDSLRLEAGMCLYGHDIDDTTTPVEAGLSWIIPKSRREGQEKFNGAETILPQLVPVSKGGKGVSRRRVGLIVEGSPAREGAEIVDADGNSVGKVTSGCPSPTLKKNISMGYVKDGLHKSGTELEVVVRGKKRKAVVTKMPFVPSKYFKER